MRYVTGAAFEALTPGATCFHDNYSTWTISDARRLQLSQGVYETPATRCHVLTGDKMKLTDSIKAALAKKQAAQHPDAKVSDATGKSTAGKAPVVANKPQKKVTGRGR
jgi:hypothetical protein